MGDWKAWNGMKAGCRFEPGSAGRLNYKAKGQSSKYLLYFVKDKSFSPFNLEGIC